MMLLSSSALVAQQKRIAVLEFTNEAGLSSFEVETLADDVRGAALILARSGYVVMTRESMMMMLPPGMDLARCSEGQCEVEAGQKVGADLVVSGRVGRFDGGLVVRIKLFDTRTAALLGQEKASGMNATALSAELGGIAHRLFLRISDGSRGAPGNSNPVATFSAVPSTGSAARPVISGGPVTEAVGNVTVTAKPKGRVRLGITDPSGKKTASGSPYQDPRAKVGLWSVAATADGYEGMKQSFRVRPDEATAINLDLKRLGGMSITGPAGARVEVTGPGGFTDERGLPWRAQGLASGRYRVEVSRAGYVSFATDVRVQAGKTAEVETRLLKEGEDAPPAQRRAPEAPRKPQEIYGKDFEFRLSLGASELPAGLLAMDTGDIVGPRFACDEWPTSGCPTEVLSISGAEGDATTLGVIAQFTILFGDFGFAIGTALSYAGDLSIATDVEAVEDYDHLPQLEAGVPGTIKSALAWDLTTEMVYRMRLGRFHLGVQAGIGMGVNAATVDFYSDSYDHDVELVDLAFLLPLRATLDFYASESVFLFAMGTYMPLPNGRLMGTGGLGIAF